MIYLIDLIIVHYYSYNILNKAVIVALLCLNFVPFCRQENVGTCRRNRSRFYDVIFITFFMLLRWFESNKYEPENHNAK